MPPSSMLMGEVFQYSVANELVANGKRYILILLKGKSVLYSHDKYIYTNKNILTISFVKPVRYYVRF